MRRILLPIIILTILFTSSCTSQKPTKANSDAANASTESLQSVLYFDNSNFGGNFDSEAMDQKRRDTICLYATMDEKQQESLVNEYLRKMNTYKETPDSVTYVNGKSLVDYYSDKANDKMSFVFHFYIDNIESQAENTNASQDTIICTTINLNDFQKIGYLSYTCDDQQRTNHESLLDAKKNLIASIDYQYLNSIPFPFITKYEDAGTHNDITDDVLNINQKFWIYKDNAEFDNTGKWTGYAADIYNINSGYDFICTYDTNEYLVKITGEMDNNPDIPNKVNLIYQKSGFLDTVDYTRPSTIYGTADSSGEMHYDDKGRMVYGENYITHGTQYVFYLYNGEDKRPWICIHLDSMSWGPVTDGIAYGNQINAYLFQYS